MVLGGTSLCGPRGHFTMWSKGALHYVVVGGTSLCGPRKHFTVRS